MSTGTTQLLERLARHAADAPDRVALREVGSNFSLTYAQLDQQAGAFANTLRSSLPSGSVVMLRCPNIARYHVAFLGTLGAGMTVFPISCGISQVEFDSLIAKS